MNEGEFNVVQFFPDDTHEYVRRGVDAKEAVETFKSYISRPAAKFGIIRRVIVTDGGDCCNLEWQYGKGITFGGAEEMP